MKASEAKDGDILSDWPGGLWIARNGALVALTARGEGVENPKPYGPDRYAEIDERYGPFSRMIAENAHAERDELFFDLLLQARALIRDGQDATTETLCPVFDEALSAIDRRYPHLARRPARKHEAAEVRAERLRGRLKRVGL